MSGKKLKGKRDRKKTYIPGGKEEILNPKKTQKRKKILEVTPVTM